MDVPITPPPMISSSARLFCSDISTPVDTRSVSPVLASHIPREKLQIPCANGVYICRHVRHQGSEVRPRVNFVKLGHHLLGDVPQGVQPAVPEKLGRLDQKHL